MTSFLAQEAFVNSAGGHRVEVNAVDTEVVYFVKRTTRSFWMLTMYPKNLRDNIATEILRQIRKEVENE